MPELSLKSSLFLKFKLRNPCCDFWGVYKVPAGGLEAERNKLTLGRREYELTNHLGNVLATVSDAKLPAAKVLSHTDYYAFGSAMAGRSGTPCGGSYRYGFNGKEKAGEVATGITDFGERFHNAQVGRWFSGDPVAHHHLSPYTSHDNDPLNGIDPDGRDVIRLNQDGSWSVVECRPGPHTFVSGKGQDLGGVNGKNAARIGAYLVKNPDLLAYAGQGSAANGQGPNEYESLAARTNSQMVKNSFNDLAIDVVSGFELWGMLKSGWMFGRGAVKAADNVASEGMEYLDDGARLVDKAPLERSWDDLAKQASEAYIQQIAKLDVKMISVLEDGTYKTAIHLIRQTTDEVPGNVLAIIGKIMKDAKAAGASKVEIRGAMIVGDELKPWLQKLSGKSRGGLTVTYTGVPMGSVPTQVGSVTISGSIK
jgi:RHS repeat-associated protein